MLVVQSDLGVGLYLGPGCTMVLYVGTVEGGAEAQ